MIFPKYKDVQMKMHKIITQMLQKIMVLVIIFLVKMHVRVLIIILGFIVITVIVIQTVLVFVQMIMQNLQIMDVVTQNMKMMLGIVPVPKGAPKTTNGICWVMRNGFVSPLGTGTTKSISEWVGGGSWHAEIPDWGHWEGGVRRHFSECNDATGT